MKRIPPVLLASALLLSACSAQPSPSVEVMPAPTGSASPLLAPQRSSASASSTPTTRSTPAARSARMAPSTPTARQAAARPELPRVPITGTDPATTLPSARTAPVKLQVNSLDLSMPVVPVGVEPNGQMALPASVAEVGWYEFGPRPADQTGATVLAAHVDTVKEGLGPFARLRTVRKGAEVVLTARNGASYRYTVTSVETVSKSDVPLADVFGRQGQPLLTLITCGGGYDRDTGYTDNVVVTASLVSSTSS